VVHRYTCDLPVGPAQKSVSIIEVQKFAKLKVWTIYTSSVLYCWYPSSSSWLFSEIGLVLPSPSVIVAFSIVLYCKWYATTWFVKNCKWSCHKWYQNIGKIKGFKINIVQNTNVYTVEVSWGCTCAVSLVFLFFFEVAFSKPPTGLLDPLVVSSVHCSCFHFFGYLWVVLIWAQNVFLPYTSA
jgi:hypothetical protein